MTNIDPKRLQEVADFINARARDGQRPGADNPMSDIAVVRPAGTITLTVPEAVGLIYLLSREDQVFEDERLVDPAVLGATLSEVTGALQPYLEAGVGELSPADVVAYLGELGASLAESSEADE